MAAPSESAGLQVEFNGGLVTEAKESSAEGTGMMIAFVVLAITLGSLLAAGLPLLTALIGVGIGVAGLTALSGVVELSKTAPDPGHDARPCRRDRLRTVHPLPPPPEHGRRAGHARGGRAGHRNRRQRRRVRRRDRDNRARRPDRREHPVPDGDGPGGGGHGDDCRADRALRCYRRCSASPAGGVARFNRVLGYRPGGRGKGTDRETAGLRWARFVTAPPPPGDGSCAGVAGLGRRCRRCT